MASSNSYAEGKEHFLFAYDAPMAFQIHFCLTIKSDLSEVIQCVLYKLKTGCQWHIVRKK